MKISFRQIAKENRIRDYLDERNVSIFKLSIASHITERHMRSIISGKIFPKYETLLKMMTFLDTTIHELYPLLKKWEEQNKERIEYCRNLQI